TTAPGAAMLAARRQARPSPGASDAGAEQIHPSVAPRLKSRTDTGRGATPARNTERSNKRSRGPPWCRSAGTLEGPAAASWRGGAAVSRGETPTASSRGQAREERHNEKNAHQRDAGGRTAGRDRRWTDPVRHRHRAAVEGAEEVQHLQGPHHPARTLARGRLRRIRRRAPRLPPAEGNLPRPLPGRGRPEQGRPQGTAQRTPGTP